VANPNAKIHHSTRDTYDRSYDRAREQGIPRESAQKLAEQATRETHEIASKKK